MSWMCSINAGDCLSTMLLDRNSCLLISSYWKKGELLSKNLIGFLSARRFHWSRDHSLKSRLDLSVYPGGNVGSVECMFLPMSLLTQRCARFINAPMVGILYILDIEVFSRSIRNSSTSESSQLFFLRIADVIQNGDNPCGAWDDVVGTRDEMSLPTECPSAGSFLSLL